MNPAAQSAAATQPPPGENQGVYTDPLSGFNEPMFTFNLKLDDWVLRTSRQWILVHRTGAGARGRRPIL